MRASVRIVTALSVTLLAAPLAGCAGDAPGDAAPTTAAADSAPERTATDDSARFLPAAPSDSLRSELREVALEVHEGEATFYADHFEGRRTASGRTFRQAEMVAAHPAFPFGTRLRVTNLRNDRTVEVEVVDRGPFASGGKAAAAIDLSRAAAERIDIVDEGRARVRIEVLEWG